MDTNEIEIEKFFVKIKQLWKAGWNAHLDLDANGGQAWVGLRLQLSGGGLTTMKAAKDTLKKSNSREWRRARIAFLRNSGVNKEKTENDVYDDAANARDCKESSTNEGLDTVATENVENKADVGLHNETEEVSIKQDNCSNDDDDHVDSNNEAIVIAENCVGKVIHSNTEEVNVSVKTLDIANTSSGTTTESVHTGETFEKKNIDKGIVYATVVLQNSPFSRIV